MPWTEIFDIKLWSNASALLISKVGALDRLVVPLLFNFADDGESDSTLSDGKEFHFRKSGLEGQYEITVCSRKCEWQVRPNSRDSCTRIPVCVVPFGHVKVSWFFTIKAKGKVLCVFPFVLGCPHGIIISVLIDITEYVSRLEVASTSTFGKS